jgi:hypothetical protein
MVSRSTGANRAGSGDVAGGMVEVVGGELEGGQVARLNSASCRRRSENSDLSQSWDIKCQLAIF